MRVMDLNGHLSAMSAVLLLAASVCLGSPAAAQSQVTNLSSVSLHAMNTPFSPPGSSGPGPNPIRIDQENINVASQELDITGCAEAIDQVIFQTSLNFNLTLQGFPASSFDPLQILNGVDLSNVVSLDKVPFTFPAPADPNATVTNQTIVQTSVNINAPGATAPDQAPQGVALMVTQINGDDVSEVDQANLNVATQVVTTQHGFGTIDQAILQTSVNFDRTLQYTGQPLDLSSLLSGLDLLTPLQISTQHVDGPGCPTGPDAPEMEIVNQSILQTALNFNILNFDVNSQLPTIHQSIDDTAVQQVNIVPEPSSLALCVLGLPGLLLLRRRSERQPA